nr:MAG TPA: hypothetical protein [Caudoviricetes sp.]
MELKNETRRNLHRYYRIDINSITVLLDDLSSSFVFRQLKGLERC